MFKKYINLKTAEVAEKMCITHKAPRHYKMEMKHWQKIFYTVSMVIRVVYF